MGQDGEEEKERMLVALLAAAAAAAAARTKFLWHSVQTEDANPPIASPGRSEIPLAAIVTNSPNDLLLYRFFPDYSTVSMIDEMPKKNVRPVYVRIREKRRENLNVKFDLCVLMEVSNHCPKRIKKAEFMIIINRSGRKHQNTQLNL
ncbi:hypothetical protein V1478_011177 [Vespula squamosa]|uniref:Uncharacterized protein n=1 Tax=Vespula squamosa TaxID=30214 RepID=A0ABD2ADQ8_VESSQ